MALASPTTAFTRYVKKHKDLRDAFAKSGASSMAAWGKKHWTKHGRKEGARLSPASLRSSTTGVRLGEAAATKNKAISDADYASGTRISSGSTTTTTEPTLKEEGTIGANDSWNAVNFKQASGNNTSLHTKGAVYNWRVTGPFEHKPARGGLMGGPEKKRFRMDMNGETGYAMVLNVGETDKTKWEFAWTPASSVGGGDTTRWNFMEGLPDIYLGNLYEAAETEDTPTTDPTPDTDVTPTTGGGGSDPIDDSTADIMSTFATKTSANDPLELADNSGYSATVLTAGVQEQTQPSVLTPTSAGPTTAYEGSTALSAGLQVVDTVTGTVYPNRAAATAAGVKTWMYKTEWDARETDTTTTALAA